MRLIHEGKVKRVYSDPESQDRLIVEFTDAITAGDGAKREVIEGKGEITCDISVLLFDFLKSKGIDTHFISRLDVSRILCRKVSIFPVEVVCRNLAAGSFARRYGLDTGRRLSKPLIEFFLKDDELHDPLITTDAIVRLGLATEKELTFMRRVTLAVNYYLSKLLAQVDLKLVDFKLEFGKTEDEEILVADEISGDTMRVWDEQKQSLDKDIFRGDKGNVLAAYKTLFERLKQADPDKVAPKSEPIQIIVMPKKGIKNPPGDVAKSALNRLGYTEVREVRMGKVFQMTLNTTISATTLKRIAEMNKKLLANPIAEVADVRLG